ncbi:MAG: hypothetical protein V1660_03835 [archaeon]
MRNIKLVFLCVTLFLILNIFASVASAATNETEQKEKVNQAYNWISNSVRDKFKSLSVEDMTFSLLATAYDDGLATEAREALASKKSSSSECWPDSSCSTKDTALAVFSLSRIGVDTSQSEEWLMMQNGTPLDLVWYMQMDTQESANCTLSYDTYSYNVTLNNKKKLNKAIGACLSLSYGNYWLKVSSACYGKEFGVSCDKDYVTSLFYQKPGSTTVYISSDTKRESAGNEVKLKISSVCLKRDGNCDYESTAWAALALLKNHDISVFLPYLVGYSDNNAKLLPNAFLFALTGQEDYANALLASQKKAGYWQAESTAYNKYYDTALAMLALQDYSSDKKETTKAWLLSEQVKNGENIGSWQGSKKDTAFILFSTWPKEASYLPDREELICEDYGYYCEKSYNCDFENRIDGYTCGSLDVCCNQKYQEEVRSCNEMGGFICDYALNQICEGDTKSSLDGTCCMGYCKPQEQISSCEENDRVCRSSCIEGETESSYDCANGDICCESSGAGTPLKKSKWGLIIFLLILILIVAGVAAFLFRDKIKDKFKKKPRFFPSGGPPSGLSSRPMPPRFMPSSQPIRGMGPVGPIRPNSPFMPPQQQFPQARIPPASNSMPPQNKLFSLKKTKTDKELEDTLQKLKNISDNKQQ